MFQAYGIHGNENIVFFTKEAAEDYLLKEYPEYSTSKDSQIDLCENMIWEDRIIRCEGCDEASIDSDRDEYWFKARCCDQYYCHPDCHN